MLILDAMFRFSGLGMLILIAIAGYKNFRTWPSAGFLCLSCVSLGALFLGYTPAPLRLSDPIQTIVRFLDVPHLVFVWLFVLTLFSVKDRGPVFYGLAGIIYCLPILWFRIADLGWVEWPPRGVHILASVFSVILMLHLLYKTIKEWGDDLVNQRRKTRLYFLGLVFLITMISAVTEFFNFQQLGLDRTTIKILCIWPAILFAAIWLVNLDFDHVNFGATAQSPKGLTARQERFVAKLNQLMLEKKLYENNGLKMSELASQLGVTQHKLREIINQDIGYKNFSTYLNAHRIRAVKSVFADPKMRDVPILTIALDSGFNSLTTFNRVFKQSENMTPSEYRRQVL